MKYILLKISFFIIITTFWLAAAIPVNAQELEIALFVPRNDTFWKRVEFFTQDAADDLGMRLKVYSADDKPDRMVEQVQSVVKAGIDGIIFPSFQNIGEQILQISEENRVPAILINSPLLYADHLPRMKYKYWIGSIIPDDERVGSLLAQQLIGEARKTASQSFHVLAIEGNPKDESSKLRIRGLNKYVKYEKDVASLKIVTGLWNRRAAYLEFQKYYRDHPEVNIVWCADDDMALGVVEAIKTLAISKPIIVGGVDWNTEALESLARRQMHVSIGGHFLDGAWAAILMYDFLRGFDFANEAATFKSPMVGISYQTYGNYASIIRLESKAFQFSQFSKARNPALKLYQLDLKTIAEELDAQTESFELTELEKSWLAEHSDVRLGIDPEWPPFDFVDANGTHAGIASDYVRILNEHLKLKMKPVRGLAWTEVLDAARSGKIDAIAMSVETPDRSKYLNFTRPYLRFPMVILTRRDAPFINGIQDFDDHRIAVVKGHASQEMIGSDFPGKKLFLAKNIDEALQAVSSGKIDAYVDNIASITYAMQKLGLSNLKVAMTTPYSMDLAFGVRKDWSELVTILDKSLRSISAAEIADIHNRWINVRFEKQFDWGLVFKIVIPIIVLGIIIVVVFFNWNRALSREVTERKRAEEAIKNSEKRLAQIIDFLPDSTWVIDNEGKVVAWNKAVENLTGVKADDILGKGDYEYSLAFYDERRPVLIDLVRKWNHEYEKEYLSVRKDGDHLISESFHPDLGSDGMYLSGIAGKLFDSSGQATGAIEAIRDITAMKKAEMELKKLSRAIEQSPTSVVITDPDGIIEYVNPKFSEISGYSREEAVGQNPRILNSGVHPQEYFKEMWDTILAGNEWRGELCNKKKNGDLLWESASVSPIRNAEGRTTHFVAVKEDITERKRMEEELREAKQAADEANKAKGDFLANMSHEIRTPMNAVIGMTHLALKTDLTRKQQDYLNKIQSSANSLLGIINDILDFSKIEAGKLDMESVDFNLDDVMDNLANLVTVKAQEKEELEVLFAIAGNVPRHLVGDSLRLGQVLINLTNNSVKFTETGEIVVSTKLVKLELDRITLQFSVSDTGIGLTKDQVGRLFQSFTQADTSTTRKYGGTGLGLTISKRLVEMMGGEIWVESEPGRGTTFSFTARFGKGQVKEKKRPLPPVDLRGTKVLVVDDNATSRDILREMLASFSFEVTAATSGEEGLKKLESAPQDQPYELVIMDWKMPGMDGIEASRRIKADLNLAKAPAIVLVTAYGREEVMQQAEEAGLDGFLLKPVSPSVLFDATMQAFGEDASIGARTAHSRERETAMLEDIQGARILLVEDNEINQQVALEILESAGFDVTVADNGKTAISAISNADYDAVLMDIQMPVMDGYTATREIRRNPQYKDLPIVAMTAHAMAGDHEKSLDAGMNDHVTKPIDPDKLFTTLGQWIRSGNSPTEAGQAAITGDAVAEPAGRTARAVAGPAEGEPLPETLAGFDLSEGLRRLQGNRVLYRKLLLNFAADYSLKVDEIRAAMINIDPDQARSLAHALKGVAGNLAANDLQAAAAEVELLFKNALSGDSPLPDILDKKLATLAENLGRVVDAIDTLGPEEEKNSELPVDQTAEIPAGQAREAAGRLRDAAEMGDVTELLAIAAALKSQSDGFVPHSDKIARLADDFDFDGILQLADELDSIAEV